jgi:hypothetical protein
MLAENEPELCIVERVRELFLRVTITPGFSMSKLVREETVQALTVDFHDAAITATQDGI